MSTPPRPPRSVWISGIASALLAATAGLLIRQLSKGFCLDDAFIHLSYALSVRLGDGLSYNPGDWETGASSPLWVALLVPLARAAEPMQAVQALGAALHGLTALATALAAAGMLQPAAPPRARVAVALSAATLAALHPGLLLGVASGMEVNLTALCVATALAAVAWERPTWAALLALLAVLARPESWFFLGAAGGLWWLLTRRPAALACVLGASAGMGVWVAYCLTVSGYPFPNTRYVKQAVSIPDALQYLQLQVVTHEPWLVALAGPVLIALSLRASAKPRVAAAAAAAATTATSATTAVARHRMLPLALIVAWTAGVVAIALTRKLDPQVLFFHRRYFVPFTVVAALGVALAAGRDGLRLRMLWLVPIVALSLMLTATTQDRQRLREQTIERLKLAPARRVATLPADSVVVVEGAGAVRYLAPRSIRIVDMLGLNERRIAHLPPERRPCVLVANKPTHLLLPTHMLNAVVPLFEVEQIARWDDASYAQLVELRSASMALFRVRGVSAIARRHCPDEVAAVY